MLLAVSCCSRLVLIGSLFGFLTTNWTDSALLLLPAAPTSRTITRPVIVRSATFTSVGRLYSSNFPLELREGMTRRPESSSSLVISVPRSVSEKRVTFNRLWNSGNVSVLEGWLNSNNPTIPSEEAMMTANQTAEPPLFSPFRFVWSSIVQSLFFDKRAASSTPRTSRAKTLQIRQIASNHQPQKTRMS